MQIRFHRHQEGSPAGKLADAEVHFTGGPLEGLKLVGFAVWDARGNGARNVTMPSRQYSVNGERRSFALLRVADGDASKQEAVRDLILSAFAEYERTGNQPGPVVEAAAAGV